MEANLDTRGFIQSNSTWFRTDSIAIRISEIVSVTFLESKDDYPYRIRLKSGDKFHVSKDVGEGLLKLLV